MRNAVAVAEATIVRRGLSWSKIAYTDAHLGEQSAILPYFGQELLLAFMLHIIYAQRGLFSSV